MEQNKYIYIRESNQVAGPLTMEKPERDTTASLRDSTDYIERNIVNWYKHLKTLLRIDVIGEHFFKDGQILENRKDLCFQRKRIQDGDTKRTITVAIPVNQRLGMLFIDDSEHGEYCRWVDASDRNPPNSRETYTCLVVKRANGVTSLRPEYVEWFYSIWEFPLGHEEGWKVYKWLEEIPASQEVKGNATQQAPVVASVKGDCQHIKTGVELIAEERQRQVEKEGWTAEHDSDHDDNSLAIAAVCYALPPVSVNERMQADYDYRFDTWPWDLKWWKPNYEDRVRELVKAGALIAAEIDRLNS